MDRAAPTPWSSRARGPRQRAAPTAAAARAACAADARWSWSCVYSLNGSSREAQFLLRQRLPWRLHGRLAGAPVLFVLSTLPRVTAFDLGRVGARHRHFDRAFGAERSVGFRVHRKHAEAGIGTGLAVRRRIAVAQRIVVGLRW